MNYLVIEGNIGAGKTSLAKQLAFDYNAKLILEQFAENPFLPKFYDNPERYSFPLELSFLAERYHQLNKELNNKDLFHPITIADYYFMKSLIFSKKTLSNDEYGLYRQIFNIIYNSIPKPDLFVYLHLPVNKLLENINKRARNYEKNIKADYLQSIQNGYFEFFKQSIDNKFLIIDTSNLDFVGKKSDYQTIKELIFNNNYSNGITRITI